MISSYEKFNPLRDVYLMEMTWEFHCGTWGRRDYHMYLYLYFIKYQFKVMDAGTLIAILQVARTLKMRIHKYFFLLFFFFSSLAFAAWSFISFAAFKFTQKIEICILPHSHTFHWFFFFSSLLLCTIVDSNQQWYNHNSITYQEFRLSNKTVWTLTNMSLDQSNWIDWSPGSLCLTVQTDSP